METLKLEKPTQVQWDYDTEADVLYISFGPPQHALTLDVGGGLLLRYIERSGKVIGFTIIGLSNLLQLQKKHRKIA